jgi:hypothetical protein
VWCYNLRQAPFRFYRDGGLRDVAEFALQSVPFLLPPIFPLTELSVKPKVCPVRHFLRRGRFRMSTHGAIIGTGPSR